MKEFHPDNPSSKSANSSFVSITSLSLPSNIYKEHFIELHMFELFLRKCLAITKIPNIEIVQTPEKIKFIHILPYEQRKILKEFLV